MRKCPRCQKESSFYKRKNGNNFPYCIQCTKELSNIYYAENKENIVKDRSNQWKFKIKSKYGITAEDYEKMYKEQNGKCRLCGKEVAFRKLCVDHDHKTGKVRGLLCHSCNINVGHYESIKEKGLDIEAYLA